MLEIKNVSKRLGDFFLDDISISVEDGEYFVILGPTGTGKSVVLDILSGYYRPDSGTIIHRGRDITNVCPEDRGIGFVYQDYLLFPHINVRENIVFGLRAKKEPEEEINEKLKSIARELGIEHILERMPSTLSGGEMQRAALARALITSPEILLMDEPLSALDPRTKERLIKTIRAMQRDMRPTTIHITHDFNEALSLADRIAVMEGGKIVQSGRPDEVFKNPNSRFVAEFTGTENIFEGTVCDGVLEVSESLCLKAPYKNAEKLNASIRAQDVKISMEEPGNPSNAFNFKVFEIVRCGLLSNVYMDAGVELVSQAPTQMVDEMGVRVGDYVWAYFEDSNVNFLNRSE